MEERLKILKLLEEGKINAEEAARLLEALGKEAREGPLGGIVGNTMDSVSSVLATIPGIVRAGLSSVRVGEGQSSVEVSPKERVVKSMGGNLELTTSKEKIRGQVEGGFVRSLGSSREVVLKALGGDARFSIPSVKDLAISSLGGNLSGEIAARALSVTLMGGDVELTLGDFEKAEIKTNAGDIELAIPEDSNLSFDLHTNWGEVKCDLPLTQEEKGETFLRGVLNKPKAKLSARTLAGSIHIKKRA